VGNNIAKALTGNWRVSGIYRYVTGPALQPGTGTDQVLNGNTATQRPNQIASNVYGGGFLTNYLNPAAFAEPALGTFGNMGTYSLRGPGTGQLDAGVARAFRVWEQRSLEIRAEAFNLPNNFLRGQPSASVSSNTFGQITSAINPRVLQIAAKFVF
jgi:hypothetical protein